ncbi:72d26d1f-1d0e-493e-8871-02b4135c1982-CDS [Sclerotinia trifoliorum]|uniref:72d26d1f-1d0e-493e-8871-02b4135c1982-CDS n=1 Tax=Sclerotinia trifoliorum TaxID=28548 RepID=A0A8H2VWF4_9HELO|nr:72d26d1f-1d0e-493e-8871-02b4135c1982-CDS [Sclerotinia trifoliorum]
MWDQLEPTPPHITYLFLPLFLIIYALFSNFIRDHLHLSEPPLAVLFGIVLGPYVLKVLTPKQWGFDDEIMQEITRVIVGIQCFAVGIELPKHYFKRHWKSVLCLLGPVMTFSWAITSFFAYFIFQTTVPTALIIGACLSPTDPILANSVLSESRFSKRVPPRIRHLLSAESACNDGVSFPFLYIGLVIFTTHGGPGEAIKEWITITLLWQCALGIITGLILGNIANRLLRFSDAREYISRPSFVVFYLLLAILSIGIGSILGSDDFLVAFGAGVGFAHDGWFSKKTRTVAFPVIVDHILNSTMFVYFGSIIPWDQFQPTTITPNIKSWTLVLFLILVLLFRRIPILLLAKPIIPDIRTYREALFAGHFGPMGVGALFLAIEARAQLERGTSLPLPTPRFPHESGPVSEDTKAIWIIWPVVCFVVLGSTMVHGLSVLGISLGSHFMRKEGERAPLLGGETDGLEGMIYEGGGGESEPEVSGSEAE